MIKNASQMPQVYFGLHFCEGVAEYREKGKDPYRIMINENTAKKMDKTFTGRPVYVGHVDDVNVADIGKAQEGDKLKEVGYVVRSFYNKADGKHWAEFIVMGDEGHSAIRNKWKLSNAYVPKGIPGGSGLWHGVEYSKEIMDGEYEHLALVPNPRYEESIILTQEEFKAYNQSKETELLRLQNSKGDLPMFNFFKKETVTNSAELEASMVTLAGKDMSVKNALEAYEKILKNGYHCNGDEMVTVGDSKMSVNDLSSKYAEMKKNADAMEEEKKKNSEATAKEEAEKKANEGKEDTEKKENEESEEDKKKKENEAAEAASKVEEEKKTNSKNFDKLKNAADNAAKTAPRIVISNDMVALGKKRYGK